MKDSQMKKQILLLIALFLLSCQHNKPTLPRVFVFTDININSGDPDDRQSLIHLLWFAEALKIEGIVPDRWNAQGYEACQMVVDAFRKDYSELGFKERGYPAPEAIENCIAKDSLDAMHLFHTAASVKSSPLYVLIWGNMKLFKSLLIKKPELSKNIRLITIGTGRMLEEHIPFMPESWPKTEKPCEQYNWNGFGRETIYREAKFLNMWWLEINWTYAGMFSGDEPKHMFEKLSKFGHLGRHIKEVVKNESWAQYFRVGDTPSVLYVIDTDHNLDDPVQSSWAGRFVKPFPAKRPNYYTDDHGSIPWDYNNPCSTWQNHPEVYDFAKSTLEERRDEMYEALLNKLNNLYNKAE